MDQKRDIIPICFILASVIGMAVLLAMVSKHDAKMTKDIRFISLPKKEIKAQGKRFLVVEVTDIFTDSIYSDTISL
jgi:hypothetical protein